MGLPRGGIPHDSGFSGTFPLDWPLSPGWSPRRPLWAAGTLTQLCCRGLSRAFLLPPGHILDAMAAEGPPGPALPGSPEMAASGGLLRGAHGLLADGLGGCPAGDLLCGSTGSGTRCHVF